MHLDQYETIACIKNCLVDSLYLLFFPSFRASRIDKRAMNRRVFCSQWIVKNRSKYHIFALSSRPFQDGMYLDLCPSWISIFRMPCFACRFIFISNCNVFAHYIAVAWTLFSILFIITLVSWKTNSYHIFCADLAMSEPCFCCVLFFSLFIILFFFRSNGFDFCSNNFYIPVTRQICQMTAIRLFCYTFFCSSLFVSFAIGNCISNETLFFSRVYEKNNKNGKKRFINRKIPKQQ